MQDIPPHDDTRTDLHDRADPERAYPAERAFSTPRDRPAWKEIETSPSAGWRAVYAALGVGV